MTRMTLLLLTLFVLPAVFGGTLYKWVDDQGNVHYSDKPHTGATKMHLPNAQTYTAPGAAEPISPEANDSDYPNRQPQRQEYSTFLIASPASEETFSNVESVTVSVNLQPGLQPGDRITITMDGQSQGPGTALSATFNGIDRGEHKASATLTESNGQTMSTPVITFYVQKATQKML